MFRLCWEKYIIDKKFNGYYLWERVAPFQYVEVLSGVDSLLDFFIKDNIKFTAEHILSKAQAKALGKKKEQYSSSYKTHIKLSIEHIENDGYEFDYGTFEDFIAEFTKQQLGDGWEQKNEHPESFFAYDNNSKVHACHYIFNGVYMLMKDVKDFIRVEEFLQENKLESASKGMKINKWQQP